MIVGSVCNVAVQRDYWQQSIALQKPKTPKLSSLHHHRPPSPLAAHRAGVEDQLALMPAFDVGAVRSRSGTVFRRFVFDSSHSAWVADVVHQLPVQIRPGTEAATGELFTIGAERARRAGWMKYSMVTTTPRPRAVSGAVGALKALEGSGLLDGAVGHQALHHGHHDAATRPKLVCARSVGGPPGPTEARTAAVAP